MAERKQTPDILGRALSGDGLPSTASTNGAALPSPSTSPLSGESESEKVKVSYYFSEAGAEAVDDLWYGLRSLAPTRERGQISKSLIADMAVQAALADFEANGKNSVLAQRLGLG